MPEPIATVVDDNDVTWQVVGLRREESSGRHLFTGECEPIWVAWLRVDGEGSLFLSRYDDEDYWAADSHIKANGFPVFAHGTGSRTVATKVLESGPVIAKLNQLITEPEGI